MCTMMYLSVCYVFFLCLWSFVVFAYCGIVDLFYVYCGLYFFENGGNDGSFGGGVLVMCLVLIL